MVLWSCLLMLLVSLMAQMVHARPGHEDYLAIHKFIDEMQAPPGCNPKDNCNCDGVEFVWSDMYCGGGFAAHFQLAAAHWMRAAALTEYKMPVLIIGPIWQYSEGPECKHVGGDWTCFFEAMAPCQKELKEKGKQIQVDFNKLTEYGRDLMPEQFRHVGIAYWWGLIQERMFRMQPPVQEYVAKEASSWFPGLTKESLAPGYLLQKVRPVGPGPVVGMHVRHGDKQSDGFKHHALDTQLQAVRASPECKTLRPIEARNSSSETGRAGDIGKKEVCLTDNGTQLPIYVASDDPAVLTRAAELGHLVDSDGVSQHTQSAGMLTTLLSKPEMGYNATLEIIRDITLLTRCSTLVGIAASQVFRMAVGISNATGTLVGGAWAMDHAQLTRVAQMSAKYHLPLLETFQVPA
jgi:hypothetical protein